MNERIRDLAQQAWDTTSVSKDFGHPTSFAQKFAELIIAAIYDEVKEELIHDDDIAEERDPMVIEYLQGMNAGTIDALGRIKNFGSNTTLD